MTDLADVCRASGLTVWEVDGWETRSRSSGGYGAGQPSHLMCHHTASGESADGWPDVEYIAFGSDIAPISNLYLSRSGEVWVIAAGATNTNGSGSDWWGGGVPDDSMNTSAIGTEAGNNGIGEHWPETQQSAYLVLMETLQGHYNIPTNNVRHHREWAPDRKVDCAGPSWWAPSGSWDYDAFRRSLLPAAPPSQGDDDEMAYGPYLIQGTGKDGTLPGKVYACDRQFMTVRWLPDEEALEGYRWQLREAGASAPELQPNGPIMAVDKIAAFGVVIE